MEGEKVISRDGKFIGRTTGGERICQMEGCGGRRIAVRWTNKKGKSNITYPCTAGMDYKNKAWKIL